MAKNKTQKVSTPEPIVTEAELIVIQTVRAQKKLAAAALKRLENELEAKEAVVMDKLRHKAKIEGGLSAVIDNVMGACRPKYQELYVELSAKLDIPGPKALQIAQDRYPAVTKEVLVIGSNNQQ